MVIFHLKRLFFVFVASTLFLTYSFCYGDSNEMRGSLCLEADNSTVSSSFQTNLNNIFQSLSSKGPLNSGFYKATAGKGSDKIYGLIQCRGEIAAQDCANCTAGSVKEALYSCLNSKNVALWFKWCFLHYSNEKFFGVLEPTRVGIFNSSDVDDSSVVSKGLALMSTLASTAQNQPLMFQTTVIEVGQSGKRYGMAQCTRDLSRSECGECLNSLFVGFEDSIKTIRRWEIYSLGCSMWYDDYQFYYNISTTVTSAEARKSGDAVVVIIPAFLMYLTYLLVL